MVGRQQNLSQQVLTFYHKNTCFNRKDMRLTFRGLRHPEGADDFADTILRANAVRSHVPTFDDLSGGDFGV